MTEYTFNLKGSLALGLWSTTHRCRDDKEALAWAANQLMRLQSSAVYTILVSTAERVIGEVMLQPITRELPR
jgi:hypothetical protein